MTNENLTRPCIITINNGEIVFYDEPSECFIYQTMDVKKTSSVFYRTIGIEFSRIKKDVDPTDGLHGGSHFMYGNQTDMCMWMQVRYQSTRNGLIMENRENISLFR